MTRIYHICQRCVMDTSDNNITFNIKGECNHCESAIKQIGHLEVVRKQNKDALNNLIIKIRKNPGREGFHAIVGVSGGIDSSYLLHLMSKENLKLLAVHIDAGWNSIEAVKNINAMVSKLDIELETIVIDWEEMKNLQLAYLKSGVINQDVPQDHAFFSSLFKLAEEFKIKYVISGSNYATESILPKTWGQHAMDGKQLLDINSKFGISKIKKYPITFLRNLYFKTYLTHNYRVVAPLNLIPYSKEKALKLLQEEYDWRDYGGKHKESRFTDYFQEIYLPMRFSIQKKRAHLSSLIINKEITREDALKTLELNNFSEIATSNLKQYIATKLGISVAELDLYASIPYVDDRTFANEAYLTSTVIKILKIRNKLRNYHN